MEPIRLWGGDVVEMEIAGQSWRAVVESRKLELSTNPIWHTQEPKPGGAGEILLGEPSVVSGVLTIRCEITGAPRPAHPGSLRK